MFENVFESSTIELDDQITLFAHKKNSEYEDIEWEEFGKHAEKTKVALEEILEYDGIFTELLESLKDEGITENQASSLRNAVLEMARYHDIGKINPIYQIEVLGNPGFKGKESGIIKSEHSEHSAYSAFFFTFHLLNEYDLDENPFLLLLSHIIWGHHTHLRAVLEKNSQGIIDVYKENYTEDLEYLACDIGGISKNEFKQKCSEIARFERLKKKLREKLNEIYTTLPFFYKYIYSTLIRADFIATDYAFESVTSMKKDISENFQRLDRTDFEKMKNGFKAKQKEYEKKINDNPLNPYRQSMFKEARENLEVGLEAGKRLFFLQMPTGGGKTHTSLGLTKKLLEKTACDRVIYTLPYMSLLEQNYKYYHEVTNLPDNKIRPIYSLSGMPEDSEDLENIITWDDFFEYPIICTTHVTFFNKIINQKRSDTLAFGALSNSIIVLDEVQTLPAKYWYEFTYILKKLCEKMNCYIIVMSATIPNLEDIKEYDPEKGRLKRLVDDYHYLIENPKKYYSKFERNIIKNDDIEEIEEDNSNQPVEFVGYCLEKIKEEFSNGMSKGLIVVNTVRLSRRVYDLVSDRLSSIEPNAEVLLLNSSIMPSRRDKIEEKVKSMEDELILVSTQSIEAGLDVDFNFVIRDFAPLESIEQVRGRCNRNLTYDKGDVYLTKILDEEGLTFAGRIYGRKNSGRLKETKNILYGDNEGMDYNFADLKKYFYKQIEKMNKDIKEKEEGIGLSSQRNIKNFNKLKFDDFEVKVIEEKDSHEFFVCIGLGKNSFSEKEIEILEDENLIENGNEKIMVSGEDVIDAVKKEFRQAIEEGYKKRRIIEKRWSSIISKYTVSVNLYIDENEVARIINKESEREIKFGPYFVIPKSLVCERQEKKDGVIYSIDKGFNKDFFSDPS